MTQTKYSQPRASALISSIGRVDLTQLRAVYALNAIPTATVMLATGMPATIGSVQGSLIDKLFKRSGIEITCSGGNVPGGTGLLFSGYTTGINMNQEFGMRGAQVSAVGWLDDLRATSAFSTYRTPTACWEAIAPVARSSQTGASDNGPLTLTHAVPAVYKFGGDILASFKYLLTMIAGGKSPTPAYTNSTAMKIISKIKGPAHMSTAISKDPLTLNAISRYLSSACLAIYRGGTLWDALMNTRESLGFMVVPLANSVYLVPYSPAKADTDKALSGADCVYINSLQVTRQSIAGLVLIDNIGSSTNAEISIRRPLSVFATIEREGLLDGVPIPWWLSSTINTTNTKATQDIIQGLCGRTPDMIPPTERSSANTAWNDAVADHEGVGKEYARLVLFDKVFGSNTMAIRGPFRTDISPGMTLSIDVPTAGMGGVLAGTSTLLGFVQSVVLELNSETANASTIINMSHVRNRYDNNTFGLEGNGLYTSTYDGKPLLA